MTRSILSVLFSLAILFTAQSAHARADHQEAPIISPTRVQQIDWGGGLVSRGGIRASGLPSVQKAREAARKGTAASRHRTYEPIVIRKRIDKASPMLKEAYRTRRQLPRVVVRGWDPSGKKSSTLILKGVKITSYSVGGSGRTGRETVRFSYDSIGNLTTTTSPR